MENQNEMTLEELQQQYARVNARRQLLKEQIEKRQKEYETARQEKLAAEKEARYESIVTAINNLETLLKNWNADYGLFICNKNVSPYLFHYFF